MLSLTNSFHAKKNCLEVSKAVLIFPFFLSLPPCFMFYLQADRVGQAHPFPPDDISVSFCRMEVIALAGGGLWPELCAPISVCQQALRGGYESHLCQKYTLFPLESCSESPEQLHVALGPPQKDTATL